jgi:hypothetical protein
MVSRKRGRHELLLLITVLRGTLFCRADNEDIAAVSSELSLKCGTSDTDVIIMSDVSFASSQPILYINRVDRW